MSLRYPSESERVWGLDALRFIAALWVCVGHTGNFPLTEGIDRANTVGFLLNGIYGNLFAAVPAVIVFFVISGFCIHYPYRSQESFEIIPFLLRRYTRIAIPLIAAIALSRPFQINLTLFQNSILWSLAAELIYYSLYPVLRRLKLRWGWHRIIVTSFILAFCAILTEPRALDYSPFGLTLNWLIVFPCWLLGCLLAEKVFNDSSIEVSKSRVWGWRLAVWVVSSLCSVLRFHSPVGYPWTLDLFALLVFFWLREEIVYSQTQKRGRFLEWAGKWSYSLYLMHLIANAAFVRLNTPNLGFNLNWLQKFLFILSFSYGFYLLVEKPGHLVARRLSTLFKNKLGRQVPVMLHPHSNLPRTIPEIGK
jgi:peptidoglycan/LPS O-acetylase OafA/YrhL